MQAVREVKRAIVEAWRATDEGKAALREKSRAGKDKDAAKGAGFFGELFNGL